MRSDTAAASLVELTEPQRQRAMARFAAAHGPATLVIAGGVAANRAIFARLQTEADAAGFGLSVPPAWLCTDNAAMIAWAGIERLGQDDPLDISARPRWPLDPEAEPVRGAGVKA